MDYKMLKQRAKAMQYQEAACPSCSSKGVVSRREDAAPCPNCEGTGRLWRNGWEEGTLSDRGLERLIKVGDSPVKNVQTKKVNPRGRARLNRRTR
jgi:hypothetical protein